MQELTMLEVNDVSGGDYRNSIASFGTAFGLGAASFGAGWGSLGVATAFVASPVTVIALGGLALYGGYQLFN